MNSTPHKKRLISKSHIYYLTYDVGYINNRAQIVRATALSVTGHCLEFSGNDLLPEIFETLNNNGARIVWVWDMSFFGCFCDYYALSRGMIKYDEAEKSNNTLKSLKDECYNILYSYAGVMMFRLSLKRTRKTHAYGGGKIGAIHTVEYRGLSAFFRGRDPDEITQDLGINAPVLSVAWGVELYKKFVEAYNYLTGEDMENVYTLRNVYTIGGAARRKYLTIKYGTPALSKYQKEFFQAEQIDEYFRARKLLLGGMCFFPEINRNKLVEKPLLKYDVNSLYSFTANNVGAIDYPQKSTYGEYQHDKSGEFTYIIVLKNVTLVRRKNMPNCFADPFGHYTGNVLEFAADGEEWAVFGELWEALQRFYMRETFDIVKVYRCRKVPDPAIIKYNDFFFAEKSKAKKEKNETVYLMAKLFLNNICGKFCQSTKYTALLPIYDPSQDAIIFKRGEIIDNYERGHFHYLRGAYIYTMARVKVMNDIYNLLKNTENPAQHHFYTDTDSIITDVELPPEYISDFEIGKYKLEKIYKYFGVVTHKTYYGYTAEGGHELTAAGVKKRLVLQQIYDTYGELLPAQMWGELTAGRGYEMPETIRVSGGAIKKNMPIKIGSFDITNFI